MNTQLDDREARGLPRGRRQPGNRKTELGSRRRTRGRRLALNEVRVLRASSRRPARGRQELPSGDTGRSPRPRVTRSALSRAGDAAHLPTGRGEGAGRYRVPASNAEAGPAAEDVPDDPSWGTPARRRARPVHDAGPAPCVTPGHPRTRRRARPLRDAGPAPCMTPGPPPARSLVVPVHDTGPAPSSKDRQRDPGTRRAKGHWTHMAPEEVSDPGLGNDRGEGFYLDI